MASSFSFDMVSEIDLQELDNSINQTTKEITTRYDFKGSQTTIDFNKKEMSLVIHADDDFKLKSVIDILQNKLIKRGISVKALVPGKVEEATMGSARQRFSLISGLNKDQAKVLTKMVKDSGAKVQAQIMNDLVRVTGKSKDDLQTVIKYVREHEPDFPVQFINYR